MRCSAVCVLLWPLAICAQTPAPRFEVASIKPSPAVDGSSSGIATGHGSLRAQNVTLKRCIIGAYGVGPSQIVGGPDWLDVDRFEIVAKPEGRADKEADWDAMLQTLLRERFKLALHRETRTVSALVLEVAKGGPKLEKAEGGDSKNNGRHGRLDSRNVGMEQFAKLLSRTLGLPVVNQTGLDGVFNFTLEWTPDGDKPSIDSKPSIYTAIQEQLGLRLRSQKAPVEVIVVDHAERPSEN